MIVKEYIDRNLKDKKLTCVIPMRVSEDRLDAIQRLDFVSNDSLRPDSVAVLVVDDGSEDKYSDEIKAKCSENGYAYLKLSTSLNEFSVGRCRNYGAMYSKSRYILMQDVDLYPYHGFFLDLLREINVQGMDEDSKHFLMIPYLFLTEEGNAEFFSTEIENRRQQFLHYLLIGDNSKIEKFSNGTSANVYNRIWYLSRGGNDPDFEGWGYEDLECNTRMIRHLKYFPVPREWQLQKYNFNSVTEYRSWKAVYRLFGDMLLNKGIVFFHIWHPVTEGGTYMDRKHRNESLFKKKMMDFVAHKIEPEALPDMNAGKTLLMRKNPFTFSRDIQPLLGSVIELPDSILDEPNQLNNFIEVNGIDKVMFFNPYHSEDMYRLFEIVKASGIKYWIAERGALPNSVFFDKSGFLVDGNSYLPAKWDKELSDEEKSTTLNYIRHHQNVDEVLEKQGPRRGAQFLRKTHKISSRKKVLFVALQRPSDTVTKNFISDYGSYEGFVNSLQEIEKRLPKDWVMAVKKHPLEDDCPVLEKSIDVGDAHIKDLLDLADCLLTFNSGVGVLNMAWGNPTLLAGKAFYSEPRINKEVASVDDIINSLQELKKPDSELVLRFYSYLINNFYSFGEFTTKSVRLDCGSRMTATTNIEFSVIRGLSEEDIKISHRTKPFSGWHSILFDRYRFSENSGSNNNQNNTALIKSSATLKATESSITKNDGSRLNRKLKKFRNNPKAFFAESKHAPVRMIGRLF